MQARRFVDAAEVERRVVAADVALLGETHDNPVHHELQLRLYRAAVERGRKPSLALEQLDTEHQAAVDAAAAAPRASPASIAAAGKVQGWSWSFYEPLVALALDRQLPIVAANLSRGRAREESARLLDEAVWSEERNRVLRAILVDSHCGGDAPHIDRMVQVQRARDAVMAERIAAAPAPVVAILGRGHARADLAVPLYLSRRAPRLRVLSIGFVEVSEDALAPSAYPEASAGRHDVVWFTPRAQRPDPCAPTPPTPPAAAPGSTSRPPAADPSPAA